MITIELICFLQDNSNSSLFVMDEEQTNMDSYLPLIKTSKTIFNSELPYIYTFAFFESDLIMDIKIVLGRRPSWFKTTYFWYLKTKMHVKWKYLLTIVVILLLRPLRGHTQANFFAYSCSLTFFTLCKPIRDLPFTPFNQTIQTILLFRKVSPIQKKRA